MDERLNSRAAPELLCAASCLAHGLETLGKQAGMGLGRTQAGFACRLSLAFLNDRRAVFMHIGCEVYITVSHHGRRLGFEHGPFYISFPKAETCLDQFLKWIEVSCGGQGERAQSNKVSFCDSVHVVGFFGGSMPLSHLMATLPVSRCASGVGVFWRMRTSARRL